MLQLYNRTHKAIFIDVHYNYKQLDKKLKGLLFGGSCYSSLPPKIVGLISSSYHAFFFLKRESALLLFDV